MNIKSYEINNNNMLYIIDFTETTQSQLLTSSYNVGTHNSFWFCFLNINLLSCLLACGLWNVSSLFQKREIVFQYPVFVLPLWFLREHFHAIVIEFVFAFFFLFLLTKMNRFFYYIFLFSIGLQFSTT